MKRYIYYLISFVLVCNLYGCGKTKDKETSSLLVQVGMSEKVSIPNPATASGNIEINLMGKPDFEIDYSDSNNYKWKKESVSIFPNYLADLSFAGFDKPVYVSSYAIGNFTENTGMRMHISKQTKKGLKESDVTGSCLALFVTEGIDSLETLEADYNATSFSDCYIVILDYKNGICLKSRTDFFLHTFDYWVDYDAVDVTGDGVQELVLSHEYNGAIEIGMYRTDIDNSKIAEIYSSFTDSKKGNYGEWIDTRDFKGTPKDDYKIRLQYPSIGYDKTISMINDGSYKEKDLHEKYDQDGCENYVGLWKKDGSLYKNRAKDTEIFLYTLDDFFLTKNKKGKMQIVFVRSISVRHRSETIGNMHAYFEYDKKTKSLELKKVKYIKAKDAKKEWKKK